MQSHFGSFSGSESSALPTEPPPHRTIRGITAAPLIVRKRAVVASATIARAMNLSFIFLRQKSVKSEMERVKRLELSIQFCTL